MAGSLNRAQLIGNLGRDPEIRSTQAGKKIANFSIATSEQWKDRDGEKKEKTSWHNIVCFNEHLTEIIEKYLHKGSKVFVEGALQTRKWTDNSGQERYSTEVVLQGFTGQIILLGDGGGGGGRAPPAEESDYGGRGSGGGGSNRTTRDDLSDEIPFVSNDIELEPGIRSRIVL